MLHKALYSSQEAVVGPLGPWAPGVPFRASKVGGSAPLHTPPSIGAFGADGGSPWAPFTQELNPGPKPFKPYQAWWGGWAAGCSTVLTTFSLVSALDFFLELPSKFQKIIPLSGTPL